MKLMEFIFPIYHGYLLRFIKKLPILTNFFIIKWRISPLIHHFYSPVYLVKGKEKNSLVDIKVLFYGDMVSLSYLNSILFSKKPKIEMVDRSFIFNIEKKSCQFSTEIDAVFIKTDRVLSGFLQKKKNFLIPEWIRMELDVSEPLGDIYKRFKRGAKIDIKKIKKYRYSYEISTDPKKLEFFYNKMYLPYISKKYEKIDLPLASYNDVKRSFDKGKLLLAKEGDKYVSGVVIEIHNETAYLVFMGVVKFSEVDSYYISRGVGAALYYYSIVWAKENGINTLNFGDNRPFLNDGVFQYKRKWGMRIKLSRVFFGVFGFKLFNYSEGVQSFLVNNPFIYIDKDQLKAFIFIKKEDPVNNDELQHLLKNYYTPGLTELTINSSQGFTQDIEEKFSLNHQEKTFHATFTEKNRER